MAEHLGVAPSELLKCIAFDLDGELALALVPGDREVNPFALNQAVAPRSARLYTDDDFAARPDLPKGYIGPDFAGRDVRRGRSARVGRGAALGHRRERVRLPRASRRARPRLPRRPLGRPRERGERRPVSALRLGAVGRPRHRGRPRVPARHEVLRGARRHLHRRRGRRPPDDDGLLRHRRVAHRHRGGRGAPRRTGHRVARSARAVPRSTSSRCRARATPRSEVRAAADALYDDLRAAGVSRALRRPRREPRGEVRRRRSARHAGACHGRRQGPGARRGRAPPPRHRRAGRARGRRRAWPRSRAGRRRRDGAPGPAARVADAGEGERGVARRRRVVVRAEVRRLPLHRLPRRRRRRARQPQRAPAHALLPRDPATAARRTAGAGRRRRRARERAAVRPRLRPALAAHPPGGEPHQQARRRRSRSASWPSTCSPRATTTCARCRSPNGGPGSRRCSPTCSPPVYLTPATTDRGVAEAWFDHFEGAGLDGVVAKPLDGPYVEGERAHAQGEAPAHRRLRGRRESRPTSRAGSGRCSSASTTRRASSTTSGVASSFAAPLRAQLEAELVPYRAHALDGSPLARVGRGRRRPRQRMPGGQSRWTGGKDLSWDPVRLELVAEVAFEHVQRVGGSPSNEGGRFRHTARFLRWRPDRDPGPAPTTSSTSPSRPSSTTSSAPDSSASLARVVRRRSSRSRLRDRSLGISIGRFGAFPAAGNPVYCGVRKRS